MCILWDIGNKKGAYCYAPNPDPDTPIPKARPRRVKPDCLLHCVREGYHCARRRVAVVHDKRVAVNIAG
jgi:hypothetical protein